MKYDAYAFSWAGDKYLGRSYSEMDCQAFVERCMADVGLKKDLGGSNSWYREMMKNGWCGTPEECRKVFGEIPKGAVLYILEDVGPKTPEKFRHDGIGDVTHMGIKTGRGKGAIHSSHSKGGVVESAFQDKSIPNGGWNRVGLYNLFDYGKTINWMLEHLGIGDGPGPADGSSGGSGDGQAAGNEGETTMRGTVTAPNETTVNLRKTKNGALLDRIPHGTPVDVVDYGPEWCKVVALGFVGWMMTKFITFDGVVEPGEDEPTAPDPQQGEDPGNMDPDGAREFTVRLQLTQDQAQELLRVLDSISWQLVQFTGGQG